MVFSSSHVQMWELDHQEGWAPKNWWFHIVVLEKTLVTSRRSNQSILKEINPEYSLKGLLLNLQYFDHLMRTADSLEKTLMLGKTEGKRRRGQQKMRWWMASPTQWAWIWASSGRWWRTGKPGVLQSRGSQRVRHSWATEQQQQLCSFLTLSSRYIIHDHIRDSWGNCTMVWLRDVETSFSTLLSHESTNLPSLGGPYRHSL